MSKPRPLNKSDTTDSLVLSPEHAPSLHLIISSLEYGSNMYTVSRTGYLRRTIAAWLNLLKDKGYNVH